MDEESNEEMVDKNEYHLDDDDFLSAPGSLLKNRSPKHDNNAPSPADYTEAPNNNHEEETKRNEASHKPNIIKVEKRSSIPYNISDDTSDTSEDDAPIDRKYTTQSHTVDSNINSSPNQNASSTASSKQYTILLNDKSFLHDPNGPSFPSNYIKTSKYTLLTFIPLNLFEQFRRIANIYFLMIIGVQLIPGVSPFPIETSIMPLAFILCVGAIKDGIEDYDRHKSDDIANSRAVLKLCHEEDNLVGGGIGGAFRKTISALLEPSDIILIKRNEIVPADCVVLGVVDAAPDSKNQGVCYINTSSMDGENAPKLRRALERTHNILDGSDLCQLRGSLKCPVNNKSLHGFTGCLSIKKSTIPASRLVIAHNNRSRNSVKRLTLNKKNTNYIITADDDDDAYEDGDGDEEEDVDDDDEYLAAKIVDNNGGNNNNKKKTSKSDEDAMSGLSDINFIFRGSKLVNTQSMIALVVFVGRETKLMLNRNEVPFKFSRFESILNRMILSILIFNFILCVLFAILANSVEEPFFELRRDSWFDGFLLDFCSWLILTSWMIPFSLYVTLELVKMICAQWVAWDDEMRFNNESAKTKNSNLNEELGHIDYIFTDKTGTLTQNQMELSKCSVGGHKYITNIHTVGSNDFESFASLCTNVIRYQHRKYTQLQLKKKNSNSKKEDRSEDDDMDMARDTHFILNLLLCSSTLPLPLPLRHENDNIDDVNQNNLSLGNQKLVRSQSKEAEMNVNCIEFQSPSPDEVAFAEALSSFGVILCERQADGTLVLRLNDGINNSFVIKFRVLATLEFTARRKRMTVIVLDEFGGIHLYCKGADSTLFALCSENKKEESDREEDDIIKREKKERDIIKHLTKRHLTSFARDGSRTLVIAYRSLSMAEYDEFDCSYREACIALGHNRAELIESAFAYLEHSLLLLGCTAVEDQMQEGVPQSIAKLTEAQIKVIMLTGDKQETAVSIGRQSRIIPPQNILPDSKLMFLSATNKNINNFEKQHRKMEQKVSSFIADIKRDGLIFNVLILNGDALEMCLHPLIIDSFMYLFTRCSTIICNRCNPSQKAMLVFAVKSHHITTGVALAIGDGANDVSMIQSSNVGVGLMGKEGTQASLAADFVIHRFKHIVRLLFVHGRYSFLRSAQVSLISLYKNMAFMLTVCYYGVYSLYTAQSCFDPYLMSAFNLLFAAAFPLCVGAFEQDIDQESAIHHPAAYYAFHKCKSQSLFTLRKFAAWMFTAFWQSAVWFLIAVVVYNDNLDVWNDSNGQNGGLYVWSTQIFSANVVIICCKMMMETYHWNATYFVSTAVSIAIYCITAAILSNWLYLDSDMFAVFAQTKQQIRNWLLFAVQCVLCLFPGILYNLWKRERCASLAHILYEANKFGYNKKVSKNNNNQQIRRSTEEIIQDYLSR